MRLILLVANACYGPGLYRVGLTSILICLPPASNLDVHDASAGAMGMAVVRAMLEGGAQVALIDVDPAGFDEKNLHSFNRYAYANNNPYRYVDPDGRKPEDWVTYFRLLMNPFTASFGQAGLDGGQFANASAAVQADMKAIGEGAQSAAFLAATIAGPEAAMASRSATYILSAVSYATRAEARSALAGEAGAAANQFFRGATSKAENFLIESLSDGSRRLQFFSPAKSEGFGKLYVQEISAEGRVLKEYKDTVGPSGLLDRKWVHGGSE